MDVKGIGIGVSTPKTLEQQQTIQRVQTEFLKQISKGVGEEEAFHESLKAIDEKYNPQEDTVQFSEKQSMPKLGETSIGKCSSVKAIKLPSAESVVAWLTLISTVLPKILEIIDMLPKPQTPTESGIPKSCVA